MGSNIDPATHLEKALQLLKRETRVTNLSTVYQTDPEGRPEQPRYYNCAVEIETSLPPRELKFRVLREIEQELGRTRSKDRFAARTIDLDLLLYDELVITTEDLTLPDPDIEKRPFLAIPLFELAPELVLPESNTPIRHIAEGMSRHTMKPLPAFTERLRKELLHERKS
jgi:dihydroneopterin aldolase/2-amino-4-hydroxy-6-hydroxymethyldihydropteridine diphosphokinase